MKILKLRAVDAIRVAQDYQKYYADQNRREEVFQVGDLVLLDKRHINLDFMKQVKTKKLIGKMLGPFEIMERIGNVAYKLKLPANSKAHPVFHVSALKRYQKPTDGRSVPAPEPILVGDDMEWEVEAILDHKDNRRGRLYLVKWKNATIEEATWEPERNCANAADLVLTYCRAKNLI
jgi:hypothetical protein